MFSKNWKKKERQLEEKLGKEIDEEKRNRIQQKIDVVYAQRKKGIKLIQEP